MANANPILKQARNPFLEESDYSQAFPWDASGYRGLTAWGMFPGFGEQLQGALGQMYGMTQQNVANARANEMLAWQRQMEQAQLDLMRQQLGLQEKQQGREYDLARQSLLAQMGYAADPSFLGTATGKSGNAIADLMAARGVRVGGKAPLPQGVGSSSNWSPQIQAQLQALGMQQQGALSQIQAQNQGAAALQSPMLAAQERMQGAQLANVLAQIQAQSQGALALQTPQLDAQKYIADLQAKLQGQQLGLGEKQLASQEKLGLAGYQNVLDQIRAASQGQLDVANAQFGAQERMNTAGLKNALDQINATYQGQLALQGPQLEYGSKALQNQLDQIRLQQQGQLALQGPQLDYLKARDVQEYGFKSNLANAITGLFQNNNPANSFLQMMGGTGGMQMPQTPQFQMPQGTPIIDQMPKPGQGYTPSFTGANFTGAGGQQFGGVQMPTPWGAQQGQAESGIRMPTGGVWNPQIASQARQAFSSPINKAPMFGSGQGMQSYWGDMARSLGTQGMSALNRLGPYQQAKFNLGWQTARSGAQNDMNRLMSGAYSNWRNLDVGNRMTGLRWLQSMYGG